MSQDQAACPTKELTSHIKEETSGVKKFFKTQVEKIIPCRASVRFIADQSKWAILNPDGTHKELFDHGVMYDVKFEPRTVTRKISAGCGGNTYDEHTTVGVASGKLVTNWHGNDVLGFKNLGFHDGRFVDVEGHEIKEAKVLRLMPDRRALYK